VFSNGLVGLAFPVPFGLSKADFTRFLKFDQSAWRHTISPEAPSLGHSCPRRCMVLELHIASQALAGRHGYNSYGATMTSSRARGVPHRLPCEEADLHCKILTLISAVPSETLQHARLGYANPLERRGSRYAPPQLLNYCRGRAVGRAGAAMAAE